MRLISAYRDFGRKQKREVSLDYLISVTPFEPFTTDNYFEQYDKPTVFVGKGQEVIGGKQKISRRIMQTVGAKAGCPADVLFSWIYGRKNREDVRAQQKHSLFQFVG